MKKSQRHQELLNQMDELVRQMRELKDVGVTGKVGRSRRSRVANGVTYFTIEYGIVSESKEGGDKVDQARFDEGNYYLTRVEAEEKLKKRQIVTKIKDRIFELNNGWKCDWKDEVQYKYSFEISKRVIDIDFYWSLQDKPSDLYFKSREIGEQLLQEFGNDLYYLFK